MPGRGNEPQRCRIKVASLVRLSVGPFAEKLGILDRLDDSGRVRVCSKLWVRLFRSSSTAGL
jgi:hypothetical protein